MTELESPALRASREGDEEALLAAFNRVRARALPGAAPRTPAGWWWRYRDNPVGAEAFLALDEDGGVLHHQGALPVRVRVEGEAVRWCQLVDAFGEPGASDAPLDPEAFLPAAEALVPRVGGAAPDGAPIVYGLPQRAEHEALKRTLGFDCVRNQNRLVARLDVLPTAEEAGISVEEVERFPAGVADLFDRAAAGRGALAIRDADHLNWRFATHPEREYRIGLARAVAGEGELMGYAVYRRGAFEDEEGGLVCDWLVPAADGSTARALLAFLVAHARRDEVTSLTALFPESAPEWLSFQGAGFRVRPTGRYLVAKSFQRPFDAAWLYRHWYYTLGDFEEG